MTKQSLLENGTEKLNLLKQLYSKFDRVISILECVERNLMMVYTAPCPLMTPTMPPFILRWMNIMCNLFLLLF